MVVTVRCVKATGQVWILEIDAAAIFFPVAVPRGLETAPTADFVWQYRRRRGLAQRCRTGRVFGRTVVDGSWGNRIGGSRSIGRRTHRRCC